MLTDIHVHIGRFRNGLYFSPEQVAADMKALSVTRWAFSSTSTGHVPVSSVREERRPRPPLCISKGRRGKSLMMLSRPHSEFPAAPLCGFPAGMPVIAFSSPNPALAELFLSLYLEVDNMDMPACYKL